MERIEKDYGYLVKENGDKVKVITHNGKTYEQVVRKK